MTAAADDSTRRDPAIPDRRSFWIAAAVMTCSLVVLIALFVAFYPRDREQGVTREEQVDQALTRSPNIIPTPAEGRAPDNPGDPGGWEQLLVLGLVIIGLASVGGLLWRSSRNARRRASPD